MAEAWQRAEGPFVERLLARCARATTQAATGVGDSRRPCWSVRTGSATAAPPT
jgi:hypothetical protein